MFSHKTFKDFHGISITHKYYPAVQFQKAKEKTPNFLSPYLFLSVKHFFPFVLYQSACKRNSLTYLNNTRYDTKQYNNNNNIPYYGTTIKRILWNGCDVLCLPIWLTHSFHLYVIRENVIWKERETDWLLYENEKMRFSLESLYAAASGMKNFFLFV